MENWIVMGARVIGYRDLRTPRTTGNLYCNSMSDFERRLGGGGGEMDQWSTRRAEKIGHRGPELREPLRLLLGKLT